MTRFVPQSSCLNCERSDKKMKVDRNKLGFEDSQNKLTELVSKKMHWPNGQKNQHFAVLRSDKKPQSGSLKKKPFTKITIS